MVLRVDGVVVVEGDGPVCGGLEEEGREEETGVGECSKYIFFHILRRLDRESCFVSKASRTRISSSG